MIDKLVINIFTSSIICFVMYLITAIILAYTDNIILHQEGFGILALIGYFIIPFITIHLLWVEGQ